MQPAISAPAPTAAPTKGTANCAGEGKAKPGDISATRFERPGGIIATLIESARRQETLIDVLTTAVESGSEKAILQAAIELAANRRKETPAPKTLRNGQSQVAATKTQKGQPEIEI